MFTPDVYNYSCFDPFINLLLINDYIQVSYTERCCDFADIVTVKWWEIIMKNAILFSKIIISILEYGDRKGDGYKIVIRILF